MAESPRPAHVQAIEPAVRREPSRPRVVVALFGAGLVAGAAGGALAPFVAYWLLVFGSMVGGPRPSPSSWSWLAVPYALLYLTVFAMIGAVLGGLLGILPGLVAAWLMRDHPSLKERAILLVLGGLLGATTMRLFQTHYLHIGGQWVTTAFVIGGVTGGLASARFWLRLRARWLPPRSAPILPD